MDNLQDYIFSNDGFYPEEQEMFEKVEKVLGFKLFYWQKTFIAKGHFRRYGATTAKILYDILDVNAPAIDYTRKPQSAREEYYRINLLRMKKKLEDGGIQTRTVLCSREDVRKYYTASSEATEND